MAERRMFAKTIIDSDAFLDMPLSAQALYFHLSMRADDEGFINNPKKIQRMISASEDDLKVLIAKSFIIPFETGIVVIKHWRIHNYIRADRLVDTKYTDEKRMLTIKENGAYTIGEDFKEIDGMDSADIRKMAYKRSSLPYSFSYKIKRAFEGRICPVCNAKMESSCKRTMPTIQHNTPISKGGAHELDNISVICESCNTSIQDNETGPLNNEEVIDVWDRIIAAEKMKIKWFWNPQVLEEIDVGQVTDKCQSSDGQVTDKCQHRLGKDRLGKDRLGKGDKAQSATHLLEESSLSDPVKEKLGDWLKYKSERREAYKETGLKSLIAQAQKYEQKYGASAVIDIIGTSMSSGYRGIVWDRLDKAPAKKTYTKEEMRKAAEYLDSGGTFLGDLFNEQYRNSEDP